MPLFGRGNKKQDVPKVPEPVSTPTAGQVALQITGIEFYGPAVCKYLDKTNPEQAQQWRYVIGQRHTMSHEDRVQAFLHLNQQFDTMPQKYRDRAMIKQLKKYNDQQKS